MVGWLIRFAFFPIFSCWTQGVQSPTDFLTASFVSARHHDKPSKILQMFWWWTTILHRCAWLVWLRFRHVHGGGTYCGWTKSCTSANTYSDVTWMGHPAPPFQCWYCSFNGWCRITSIQLLFGEPHRNTNNIKPGARGLAAVVSNRCRILSTHRSPAKSWGCLCRSRSCCLCCCVEYPWVSRNKGR